MMKETIKDFENTYKELKGQLTKAFVENEVYSGLESEQVELMVNMIKLCDTSVKIMKEEAEIIDRIDSKIDRLLERKEKES